MLRLVLAVLLLAVASPASAAVPVGPGTRIDVERVSFDQRESGLVARVQTSGRVRAYSIDQTDGALTLVLYRAQLAPAVAQASSVWPVHGYRLATDADRVTVRFEVDEGVSVRAYPDRDSDDLLVSFSSDPQPRQTQWGGGVSSEPVSSEPVASEPVVSTPIPERPAPTPRRDVPAEERAERAPSPPAAPESVTATGAEHWRLDTIVLDAGHGGHDAGGVGIGTTDRDVAFAVVGVLGPMIQRELGVNVVYTRETDTFVEVRDRGRIANQEGGKLFISVHGNAGVAAAYGTETFFLAPRGSARASEVMQRENAVIELESDPSYYADFADGGDILRSLAMSAYQEESQHLATLIEGEFVRAGRRSRGVKQDNFMVLWAASMPAVLVEVGFVTNPDEARLLSSRAGVEQTARAIFNAVRAYKESYERGLRAASQ